MSAGRTHGALGTGRATDARLPGLTLRAAHARFARGSFSDGFGGTTEAGKKYEALVDDPTTDPATGDCIETEAVTGGTALAINAVCEQAIVDGGGVSALVAATRWNPKAPEKVAGGAAAKTLTKLAANTIIATAVLEEVARTETDCSSWDGLHEVLRECALARLQTAASRRLARHRSASGARPHCTTALGRARSHHCSPH